MSGPVEGLAKCLGTELPHWLRFAARSKFLLTFGLDCWRPLFVALVSIVLVSVSLDHSISPLLSLTYDWNYRMLVQEMVNPADVLRLEVSRRDEVSSKEEYCYRTYLYGHTGVGGMGCGEEKWLDCFVYIYSKVGSINFDDSICRKPTMAVDLS